MYSIGERAVALRSDRGHLDHHPPDGSDTSDSHFRCGLPNVADATSGHCAPISDKLWRQ